MNVSMLETLPQVSNTLSVHVEMQQLVLHNRFDIQAICHLLLAISYRLLIFQPPLTHDVQYYIVRGCALSILGFLGHITSHYQR